MVINDGVGLSGGCLALRVVFWTCEVRAVARWDDVATGRGFDNG
jgi:hypothetical protein